MKSPFELLLDWGRKKMNLDEQISKRIDKGYRFKLWNENVRLISTQTKFKKGSFYCPFFYLLQNSTTKEQRSLFSSSKVYNIK